MTEATHFLASVQDGIAAVSLNRPERTNSLTFGSYAELRDWFRARPARDDVDELVFGPNGGNFSSGGDVHDIIGPLTRMSMKELLAFTRMTGDLAKAMAHCGKPIIAAVDGVCAGPARSFPLPRTGALRRLGLRSRSYSMASAWRAAMWAPARSCRGSSARDARPSC